jgi:hypothetical protein
MRDLDIAKGKGHLFTYQVSGHRNKEGFYIQVKDYANMSKQSFGPMQGVTTLAQAFIVLGTQLRLTNDHHSS